MSILHPSPGRREIKNPFIGLSPPSSPLSIATLFLNLNSGVTVLQFSRVGVFPLLTFFFLLPSLFFSGFALGCSDLTFDTNSVLDALVTSSKRGGVIAALGKVLYNNGLIFLFQENLFFPQCMLFFLFAQFLITCCRWLILHSCRLCCKSVSPSKLKIIA